MKGTSLMRQLGLMLLMLMVPVGVQAQMLTWQDLDTNVTGYKIERALGSGTPITCGAFVQIGTTLQGTLTYRDADGTLQPGLPYCYRVAAYNAYTTSAYSNVATFVKPLTAPVLTVTVAATGGGVGGTVASTPAGIVCQQGQTCTASFAQWTTVVLTETPRNPTSRFVGWSVAACGGQRGCSVLLAEPMHLTASYIKR